MNLKTLFETQAKLDERIVKGKGLEGQVLLDKKILALQVELGELANEWRGFKFWSENQEPNIEKWVECEECEGTGDLNYETVQEDAEGIGGHEYIDCDECDCSGTSHMTNPLLEEYVDCLHFILSIGNDLAFDEIRIYRVRDAGTLKWFEVVFKNTVLFGMPGGREHKASHYQNLLSNFLGLGKSLGFTWDQIEAAYFEKNKVNHARQNNGY